MRRKWIEWLLVVAAGLPGLLTVFVLGAGPTPAPLPAPVQFPPLSGDQLVLPVTAHDGDSVTFYWLVEDKSRLFGINAPELNTPEGKASRDFILTRLPHTPVKCRVYGRDKYGRALLEIFTPEGQSLSQIMIDNKMAKPWDGQGPKPQRD